MKAYISHKLTSSVNDVKCSNAVVSEFMNEVYDIIDITIFDFTVPWDKVIKTKFFLWGSFRLECEKSLRVWFIRKKVVGIEQGSLEYKQIS